MGKPPATPETFPKHHESSEPCKCMSRTWEISTLHPHLRPYYPHCRPYPAGKPQVTTRIANFRKLAAGPSKLSELLAIFFNKESKCSHSETSLLHLQWHYVAHMLPQTSLSSAERQTNAQHASDAHKTPASTSNADGDHLSRCGSSAKTPGLPEPLALEA